MLRHNGITPLPALDRLYERHLGLTESISRVFAEAAAICLSRHHSPPVEMEVISNGSATLRELSWVLPNERQRRAWNNVDDATRDGAYSVCIAAVEIEMGLFAVARAETRTGADYYLGIANSSLEQSHRLEVSGVDRGDAAAVAKRLREKVVQTREGISNLPAIASVVGFSARRVAIEAVDA